MLFGGPDRIRTGDLLIANEALYQLSYGPKTSYRIYFLRYFLKVIHGMEGISRGSKPRRRSVSAWALPRVPRFSSGHAPAFDSLSFYKQL